MITLEAGCSEKCSGHYSGTLNGRNELCCWSPRNLYSVTAGHLLGLDLQDMMGRAQAAEVALA